MLCQHIALLQLNIYMVSRKRFISLAKNFIMAYFLNIFFKNYYGI